LAFHKARIEGLVSRQLDRSFAIDGAFEVRLLPSIKVLAEGVRLANPAWGSSPQMVEIGHFSTEVGPWSLVSGPVRIPSFQLTDVSVLLEEGPDGKGNWDFGGARTAAEETTEPGAAVSRIPAIVVNAALRNVRISFRAQKAPERVAYIEKLTIGPGSDGLLAVSAKGRLDDYAAALDGELGPTEALVSGTDIRLAVQGRLGELRLDARGSVARLNPLRGADLSVKLAHPNIGAMLSKLQLPALITGPLDATVRLSDAGDASKLDLAARSGGITAKVDGTLSTLGLPGSDLRFSVAIADPARMAALLDLRGLPAGALELKGRAASSGSEIRLDEFQVRYAGVTAKANGTIALVGKSGIDMRFEAAAPSLGRLQAGLPDMPLLVSGNYVARGVRLEVRQIKARIGEQEFSGQAIVVQGSTPRVEVELAAPSFDLASMTEEKKADAARTKPPATPKAPPGKYVFDETPFSLAKLKQTDVKVHVAFGEVRPGIGAFRDVDATLQVKDGRINLDARAKGGIEGAVEARLALTPAAGDAVELDLKVNATRLRAGLRPAVVDAREEPPTNAEVNVRARGASARQMASGANGHIRLTQDAGKLPSGLLGLVGGGLIGELAGKLNPFSAQDPHMLLECTVVHADIADGQTTVKPVLVQSEKVTIVAGGTIDLKTEALAFDFNTRPRKGVGISAGMFANPFIHVAGTLMSPKLGASAKAATAGAAAVATGGVSVLAQGVFDRVQGDRDLCKEWREQAAAAKK
jgi:uncharacterized protein involved in outer membrane biogenesis